MLSLVRRIKQKLMIGDDVVVTVLSVNHSLDEPEVKFGINAPKEVSVHRKEVYDRIKREKAEQGDDYEDTKWNR